MAQAEETWLKRGEPIVQVKKSKYYNIPQTIPEPKKKDRKNQRRRKEEPAISEKADKSRVKFPATPNQPPVTVDQGKECTLV